MPLYRYAEFVLYSVVNLLPYLLIALYPVRGKLRFSPRTVAVILALLCAVDSVSTYLYNIGAPAGLLSLLLLIIRGGFYLVAVKQPVGKSLFLLLVITNFGTSVSVIAKYIENLLFYPLSLQRDRWSFSVCLLAVEACELFPLFLYIKNIYTPVMAKDRGEYFWRILWAVPAIFYLIELWHMYMNNAPTFEVLLSPTEPIIQAVIAAGAFLTHHIIVRLIDEHAKNEELQSREYRHQMLQAQYSGLQDRILEMKKTRHDLRYHLHVIASYAKDGKQEALLDYINRCEIKLEGPSLASYCENYLVNSLLQHFSSRANRQNIDTTVQVSLPERLPIPNETLSILFGNLLENAVEAAEKEPANAKISISCRLEGGILRLHIRNTCTRPIEKSSDGFFRSTKEDRQIHGLGLRSVRDTVRQYEGLMEARHEDNVFSVYITLPMPD